jgi:hypothetical protein
MQFRYRLSKFSLIGVVVVVFGVTVMLVSYSQYHSETARLLNQESKEQPKLRKSFSDYKPLGADSAVQEKKVAAVKSSFRYRVGAGLLIVVIGSAVMAIPARNSQLPPKKAKPTKPAAKSGARRRSEYTEE